MIATLVLVLKVSVALLILSIGLGSKPSSALYLWRQPGKLIRAILAMYVLVPLAAFLLVRFIPGDPGGKATLFVLAVSAGAPLLPRKLSRLGSDAYVYSLVLLSSVLAIIIVPAVVNLLSRHFGVENHAPVAASIAKTFLVPLGLGTLLRLALRRHSERAADLMGKVAGIALAAAAIALVAMNWSLFSSFRIETVVALVAMMLISLAIGHVMGGPVPAERTALAVSCATRHVGIAIIVASAFQGPTIAAVISAYLLASVVVSIPYLKWRTPKKTG